MIKRLRLEGKVVKEEKNTQKDSPNLDKKNKNSDNSNKSGDVNNKSSSSTKNSSNPGGGKKNIRTDKPATPTRPPFSQKKPKKKWTPGRVIMWLVILGLIGFLIWLIFFSGNDYIANATEMKNRIKDLVQNSGATSPEEMERVIYNNIRIITYGNGVAGVQISSGRDTFIYLVDTIGEARDQIHEWVSVYTNLNPPDGETWGSSVAVTFPPQPNWFVQLLLSWGPWILMMVVAWFLIRSILEKQQNKMGGKIFPQYSNVKFSDVAGYREIKNELVEIVDFLKNPTKYSSVGIRTPKGILLAGPPGTGKTLFAKSVAGEANVPFFSISGSDFVEMYVGVGAKRVRELFKVAFSYSPAIVFIDELDAVGRQRGAGVGGGNDEREQTLNQLLVELDGFQNNSGVIVLAATNRPDVLDAAITRPGRFDRSIQLRLPDVGEREAILKRHSRDKKVSRSIDFYNIAMRTPGFSGAQLENVINEAAILAVRERKSSIDLHIIDEAIDRVIGGPAKVDYTMSLEEKKLISFHEAGHALIGLKLRNAQKVQKISIVPRGIAGGYVLMTPKKEKLIQTKSELEATIASYMGGRVAEEIKFGPNEITTGAFSDIEEATKIARKMITQFGMSSLGPVQLEKNEGSIFLGRELGKTQSHSSKLGYQIDQETRRIVEEAYKVAYKIVKDNLKLLGLFSKALLIKETLNHEEIEYINNNDRLPDSIVHFKERQRKEAERKERIRKMEEKKKKEELERNKNQTAAPKSKSSGSGGNSKTPTQPVDTHTKIRGGLIDVNTIDNASEKNEKYRKREEKKDKDNK